MLFSSNHRRSFSSTFFVHYCATYYCFNAHHLLLTRTWGQICRESRNEIKDKSSLGFQHENIKAKLSPIVFSSLRRATSFCSSFLVNASSDFVLYRDSKPLYPRRRKHLLLVRSFKTLLQSASVCVTLPARALLFLIIFKTCYSSTLAANRDLHFSLLAILHYLMHRLISSSDWWHILRKQYPF